MQAFSVRFVQEYVARGVEVIGFREPYSFTKIDENVYRFTLGETTVEVQVYKYSKFTEQLHVDLYYVPTEAEHIGNEVTCQRLGTDYVRRNVHLERARDEHHAAFIILTEFFVRILSAGAGLRLEIPKKRLHDLVEKGVIRGIIGV